MLSQVLDLKKRREDEAVKVEIRARLELEQAAAALRAAQQRKADYEVWAVGERQRLYDELQRQNAVKYNHLMQWNAQVADVKQGLLDIEAKITTLEQERQDKMQAHQSAAADKHSTRQQVLKFTELVNEEQRLALLEQDAFEEREMEDFRPYEL